MATKKIKIEMKLEDTIPYDEIVEFPKDITQCKFSMFFNKVCGLFNKKYTDKYGRTGEESFY